MITILPILISRVVLRSISPTNFYKDKSKKLESCVKKHSSFLEEPDAIKCLVKLQPGRMRMGPLGCRSWGSCRRWSWPSRRRWPLAWRSPCIGSCEWFGFGSRSIEVKHSKIKIPTSFHRYNAVEQCLKKKRLGNTALLYITKKKRKKSKKKQFWWVIHIVLSQMK